MSKKILLIEDDALVRDSIVDLLMIGGFDVDVAENGKVGLERIEQSHPDLVICDVMMPVMDGYEVLEELKRSGKINELYFMFLSAKSREADMQKGMELGAHDYFFKPFRNMELLDKVEQVLSN
ncbi:MAG TPA: response regulator [Balneolaceae bacterium]|nr:response regulator [Balneolaceae bacterium]|tara:strand:- start:254514 stop:254882 length:369 start_codon:yes stop_codon:yes gene_type:complete